MEIKYRWIPDHYHSILVNIADNNFSTIEEADAFLGKAATSYAIDWGLIAVEDDLYVLTEAGKTLMARPLKNSILDYLPIIVGRRYRNLARFTFVKIIAISTDDETFMRRVIYNAGENTPTNSMLLSKFKNNFMLVGELLPGTKDLNGESTKLKVNSKNVKK